MKTSTMKFWPRVFLFLLIGLGLGQANASAALLGPVSATNKYAWSEASGWQNFQPTYGGVTVNSDHLTGFAWAANIGWVKLGADSGGPYANTSASNWGVNRDPASGALAGYAWSEAVGWINFRPNAVPVTIDPATGDFSGYAYNGNIGYIHVANASPAYKVQASIAAPTCSDGIKNGSESGVDCGGGACSTCDPGGQCYVSADCASGICMGGVCQAPTCSDGIKNGSESDVDCGGGVCSSCNNGAQCNASSDCLGGNCTNGVCQAAYPLTVERSGTGSGAVDSTPAGISCGADCFEPYAPATVVTLTQQADPGSTFAGWTGACSGSGPCQVTMDAAKSVAATFTRNSYTVTVHGPNGVKAIAAGDPQNPLALKDDGTVVSFGVSNTATPLATGIKAIAQGGLSVAVTNAGTVSNLSGDYQFATIPPGLDHVVSVAVGQYHTLALKDDGTVVGWGEPYVSVWNSIPADLSNVKALAASFDFSLALKGDGSVVQWGYLGIGSDHQPPPTLHEVRSIAAGYYHGVAVNGDGTVEVWGENNHNQLDKPAGLSGVVAVAANAYGHHSVAVKADGTVAAWGDNTHGQCAVPLDLTGVVAVAAGSTYSLALKNNGAIVAWGKTWQSGLYKDVVVPAELNDKGVIGLAKGASATHVAVIKNGGGVAAWGGDIGGLPSGFIGPPSGVDGVKSLAAGSQFAVAAKGDGTVVAWGVNSYGQATVPQGLSGVTAVATGGHHVVALKADGTVVAWGDGELPTELTTVPAGLGGVVEIAAGSAMSLARKSDGTIVAWGSMSTPAMYSVPTFSGMKAVAVGDYYAAAIKSDNTVHTWGGMSPAAPPAGLADVKEIAAGPYHLAALKNDGTVVVWGVDTITPFNSSLTTPAGLNNVVAITAGTGYVAALQNDGTVVAWGPNTYGANNVPTSALAFDLIGHGDLACETPVLGSSGSTCAITPDSGYHLVTFMVNGIDQLAGVGNNSFTITNVQADQTVSASFAANSAPSAPRNVTAASGPGGGEATISFDPPLADGGSPIYGYAVVAVSDPGLFATSDASPITVTGLPIGTPQTFIVHAMNGVGTSPASAPSNSVTPTPPTFTVTFSAASHGTVSGATLQSVTGGTNATPVQAIADAGYAFAGWSGDYTGTANPVTLRNVQGNMVITANFTLDIDGDGDGVTASLDPFANDPSEWKDTDYDGIGDNADNCVAIDNPSQADTDQDAIGDACDSKPGVANYGSVIDAPHNESRGIGCADCHSYTLWWQHSPAEASLAPAYGAISNQVCATCHAMATHASATPGAWAMNCCDCHSAHHQAQLDWRGSVTIDELYLQNGIINGNFVVNGGQTTFAYTLTEFIIPSHPEWSAPATWGQKDSSLPPSGLIMVVDIANASNTYEVISATATTITVKGGVDPGMAGKSFGLIYGAMINKEILTPTEGNRVVRFFNPKDPAGGYTDSNIPASGICQVCHANTLSWDSSGGGSAPSHDSGLNCTECHGMVQGFKTTP